MAYEVFLIAVPGGADVEESGEALLVRLARGHERTSLSADGRERAKSVAATLAGIEPGIATAAEADPSVPGALELRAPSGLRVSISDRFARFLLPFAHEGEAAANAFRQLFVFLAAVAERTGWHPYDPQEGASLSLDETSCDAALEIYLSVMDQLRPAGPAGGSSA